MSLDQFLISANTTDLNYPKIRPTLDLNFARTKTLDPRITFTRSSGGSYVGADGLIKYAGVNEPRFDHNPTTGESLGLLVEEARANINTNSAAFASWTYNQSTSPVPQNNQGIAPDGTNTAWWIPFGATGYCQGNYAIPANTASYTWSVFVKALSSGSRVYFSVNGINGISQSNAIFDFDSATLSGAINGTVTRFANGWFRLTQTFTNNGTGTIFILRVQADGLTNGRVLIWGSQIEAGSFPTSYIPTVASTVTRSADVAQITGTNFSSWYRQDEGTLFLDVKSDQGLISVFAIVQRAAIDPRVLQLGNGSAANVAQAYSSGQYSLVFAGYGGLNVRMKMANAQQLNDVGFSVNGAPALTDTSFTPPSVDRLNIGFIDGFSAPTRRATFSRLTYWPKRLPNSQLQALTR